MRKKRASYLFTGRPCKFGHVGPRYKNGNCVTCLLKREAQKQSDPMFAKAKRQRERDRHWSDVEGSREKLRRRRLDNPEDYRGYARDSYSRHREQRVNDSKQYRQNNLASVRERDRRYHAENKEARSERNRDWRLRNPPDREKARAYSADHYRNNRARYAMRRAGRRKMMREATPSWINKSDLLVVYQEAERQTFERGMPMSVDHIFPVMASIRGVGHVACGLNVPWNLRVITLSENKKLGAYGWAEEGQSPLAFVYAENVSPSWWS
jgi:hypothetical protein